MPDDLFEDEGEGPVMGAVIILIHYDRYVYIYIYRIACTKVNTQEF